MLLSERAPVSYRVLLRPGCHGKPYDPVLSVHATLEAAVRKARQSDRLYVDRADLPGWLYSAPQRDDGPRGQGRYGRGPQRGEPNLAACVAHAAHVERQLLSKAES